MGPVSFGLGHGPPVNLITLPKRRKCANRGLSAERQHERTPARIPAALAAAASLRRHRRHRRPARRGLRLDGRLADAVAGHRAAAGGQHRKRQTLRRLQARACARRVRRGLVRAHGGGRGAVEGPGFHPAGDAGPGPPLDRRRRPLRTGRRRARAQPGPAARYRRRPALAHGDEQFPVLRRFDAAGLRRADPGFAPGSGHRQTRSAEAAGLP